MSVLGNAGYRSLRLKARAYTPCMGNLEQLDWIDAFAVTGYGVRVGVRVNDNELIERLQQRLPPGARISRMGTVDRMLSVIKAQPSEKRGVRNFNLLYADHVVGGRSHRMDAVLERYDVELRLALAQYSRRKLFVHAAVVTWKGRAIVLPGRSMTGKTTLAGELVRAGATYFSDEYAVIDDTGRVHPFAKPLSVRAPGKTDQVETAVEAFGGEAGTDPAPIHLVVMSQYRDGARWRPKKLSPGQGVLELMDNTIAARQYPELTLKLLGLAASRATILKGARGEASQIANRILKAAEIA